MVSVVLLTTILTPSALRGGFALQLPAGQEQADDLASEAGLEPQVALEQIEFEDTASKGTGQHNFFAHSDLEE